MATTNQSGWFPDPQNPNQERYFDGSAWTEHTAPRGIGAPQGATPVSGREGGRSNRGWMIAAVALVAVLAVAGIVLSMMGGSGSNSGNTPSKKPAGYIGDMPDLANQRYDVAVNQIRSALNNPSFTPYVKDARGANRTVVVPENWKVCSTVPEAGRAVINKELATFSVVKIGEDCP